MSWRPFDIFKKESTYCNISENTSTIQESHNTVRSLFSNQKIESDFREIQNTHSGKDNMPTNDE